MPTVWIETDEVDSTQQETLRRMRSGLQVGILYAHHQSNGKGRFGRVWVSNPGDSLTMSIAFESYSGHPRPWLLGMAVACAVAEVIGCNIRWPNDLALNGLKIGGILTELHPRIDGSLVPVVGVGLNLNQVAFPEELEAVATSLRIQRGTAPSGMELARSIMAKLAEMPEPASWDSLAPIWSAHDSTPGKRYRLISGEEAVAVEVGGGGELLCTIDGAHRTVLAADAIFGFRAS